jgi:hypothetical protein
MLSREVSADEQTWSLASYLRPRELQAAFGQRLTLPPPTGVAPNQPSPAGIGRVFLLATTVFVAVGIGKCASAPAAEKLRQQMLVPSISAKASAKIAPSVSMPGAAPRYGPLTPAVPDEGSDGSAAEATGGVVFSPIFVLDGGRNVAFELSADLTNNWLYAAIDLINNDTGAVVSFDASLEYYSGYDSDGSWTDGSKSDDEVVGAVTAGNYVLRIEAQHGGNDSVGLAVTVRQGVFRWRWFWLGLGVLVLPFLVVGWRGVRARGVQQRLGDREQRLSSGSKR